MLLSQHINQKLFEEILRARTSLIDNGDEPTQRPLTVGEANALRYAAGYVPFSLKKLSHRPEFVQCLDQLEVDKANLTWTIPESGLNL